MVFACKPFEADIHVPIGAFFIYKYKPNHIYFKFPMNNKWTLKFLIPHKIFYIRNMVHIIIIDVFEKSNNIKCIYSSICDIYIMFIYIAFVLSAYSLKCIILLLFVYSTTLQISLQNCKIIICSRGEWEVHIFIPHVALNCAIIFQEPITLQTIKCTHFGILFYIN